MNNALRIGIWVLLVVSIGCERGVEAPKQRVEVPVVVPLDASVESGVPVDAGEPDAGAPSVNTATPSSEPVDAGPINAGIVTGGCSPSDSPTPGTTTLSFNDRPCRGLILGGLDGRSEDPSPCYPSLSVNLVTLEAKRCDVRGKKCVVGKAQVTFDSLPLFMAFGGGGEASGEVTVTFRKEKPLKRRFHARVYRNPCG